MWQTSVCRGYEAQSGCFRPAVPVMKTADSRRRRNVSASGRALFYRSICRRALVQANVSSVTVIAKVVAPKPPPMMFVQRNDVIEQFAAHASHPYSAMPFCQGLRTPVRIGLRSLDFRSTPHCQIWHHGRTKRIDRDKGVERLHAVAAGSNHWSDEGSFRDMSALCPGLRLYRLPRAIPHCHSSRCASLPPRSNAQRRR